ncbi:hypothetical protein P0D75_17165, partial [Paraburkholderia sediminicola]|uniref:hypothetical protein n=1 Tax=Paraburkholderia sediminicola TaxID=458836 RepID=UPI0038BC7017
MDLDFFGIVWRNVIGPCGAWLWSGFFSFSLYRVLMVFEALYFRGLFIFCINCAISLLALPLCLLAYGFGLSLNCYWSISVAPVRGGTYFLCRR